MADSSPKSEFKGLTLEMAISATQSILLSIGIISTVVFFKVAVIPKLASLVITTLPSLWVSFRLWLSPPYIFIVFNFIIAAVAASSAFRRHKDTRKNSYSPISTPAKSTSEDHNFFITPRSREIWNGISNEDEQGNEIEEESKSMKWDFPVLFSDKFNDPSLEKFCAYSGEKVEKDDDTAAVATAVGGGADDGVTDDGDSIDATWKAIMERKGKPTPQLKKSQTWDSPPPQRLIRAAVNDGDAEAERKPERFRQTMSFRRKISMSSEELKNRAEAFIEMVNRSIRLQRQESEQRFFAGNETQRFSRNEN